MIQEKGEAYSPALCLRACVVLNSFNNIEFSPEFPSGKLLYGCLDMCERLDSSLNRLLCTLLYHNTHHSLPDLRWVNNLQYVQFMGYEQREKFLKGNDIARAFGQACNKFGVDVWDRLCLVWQELSKSHVDTLIHKLMSLCKDVCNLLALTSVLQEKQRLRIDSLPTSHPLLHLHPYLPLSSS